MSGTRGLITHAWRPAPVYVWRANTCRGFAATTLRQKQRIIGANNNTHASPSASQASHAPPAGAFMVPKTMVPPPVLRSLRKWSTEGAKLQWERVKTRFTDVMGLAAVWLSSKPGLFKAARLRINRRAILPTAKALHRAMSESLAAGDQEGLRRVCVPRLYSELSARLARRPKGVRYTWTLVDYTRPLSYPRIVDHKVMALPGPPGRAVTVHQAVVAISSRQRLVQRRVDSEGQEVPVPGQEKELELVEHVVLCRSINQATFRASDWAIFGHIEETTWESWQLEARGLAQLQRNVQ